MRHWDDESITRDLTEVSASLGRFPSVSDLRESGRNDLMCAVTKRGGLLSWSKRLGIKRVLSDSDKGWSGEKQVAAALTSRGYRVQTDFTVKCPFDILVNDVVRLDVKTTSYTEYGPSKGWFYRIGKMPQADLVILYQQDTKDMFILPWFVCPKTNVTLSRGDGKYLDYKNRFSLLDRYIEDIGRIKDNLA